MDANILSSFGISIPVLLGIVGTVEMFKKYIPKKTKKGLSTGWVFTVINIVICFGVGFLLADPFTVQSYFLNTFIYIGASTLLYNVVIKLINNLIERLNPPKAN